MELGGGGGDRVCLHVHMNSTHVLQCRCRSKKISDPLTPQAGLGACQGHRGAPERALTGRTSEEGQVADTAAQAVGGGVWCWLSAMSESVVRQVRQTLNVDVCVTNTKKNTLYGQKLHKVNADFFVF